MATEKSNDNSICSDADFIVIPRYELEQITAEQGKRMYKAGYNNDNPEIDRLYYTAMVISRIFKREMFGGRNLKSGSL